MSFTGDQKIKLRKYSSSFSKLFKDDIEELSIACDDRFIDEHQSEYIATGVFSTGEKECVKIETVTGHSIIVSKDQQFPVIRDLGKDSKGRKIRGYKNVPISKMTKGESIPIVKLEKNVSFCNVNELDFLMAYILSRPTRFTRKFNHEPITDGTKLALNTMKTKGFNTKDLDMFRPFARACTTLINKLKLKPMKHLHWFAYKSHLGEIIYDLSWLLPLLEEEYGFDIEDLDKPDPYVCFSRLSMKRLVILFRMFVKCNVTYSFKGRKRILGFFHNNRQVLTGFQDALLDYGIMSSVYTENLVNIPREKTLNTSYLKDMYFLNGGFTYVTLHTDFYVLTISKEHVHKFLELLHSVKSDAMDEIRWKMFAANKFGYRNKDRDVYWTDIISIKSVGKQKTYDVINSNGRHVVVNGFVTSH